MIYIRLAGGLGNQLFQLNAGLYLQKKNNLKISFYTDHLKNYQTPRTFMLQEIIDNNFEYSFEKPSKYIQFILKYRINKIFPSMFKWSITKENIKDSIKSNFFVLDDYFIDIYNFDDSSKKVCELIFEASKKNKKVNEILSTNNYFNDYLNIHIRRGDYLNKSNAKIFHILNNKFYEKNINVISKNVKNIILFSNENCSDVLKELHMDKNYSKNFETTDIEDFFLLSYSKNLLIANSTFSFWAGLVAKFINQQAIVYAPVTWEHNVCNNDIWIKNIRKYNFIELN